MPENIAYTYLFIYFSLIFFHNHDITQTKTIAMIRVPTLPGKSWNVVDFKLSHGKSWEIIEFNTSDGKS